jgi:hypothetical protein
MPIAIPSKHQGTTKCDVLTLENARLFAGDTVVTETGSDSPVREEHSDFKPRHKKEDQIGWDLISIFDNDKITNDNVANRNFLLLAIANDRTGHCQHFREGVHDFVGLSFLVKLHETGQENNHEEDDGQVQVCLVCLVRLKCESNDGQETACVEQDHEHVLELQQETLPLGHLGRRGQFILSIELQPFGSDIAGETQALLNVGDINVALKILGRNLRMFHVGLVDIQHGCPSCISLCLSGGHWLGCAFFRLLEGIGAASVLVSVAGVSIVTNVVGGRLPMKRGLGQFCVENGENLPVDFNRCWIFAISLFVILWMRERSKNADFSPPTIESVHNSVISNTTSRSIIIDVQ